MVPVFIQQPLSQSVAPSERVTLSAAITGNPPPFEWEWRLGAVPQWTNVSDQRYSVFSFIASNAPSSQVYRAVVRNAARPIPGVGSLLVSVTVLSDADGDGLPDAWEDAHGLNRENNADRDADADGDGVSNYAEYVTGTDPTDAASWLKVEPAISPGLAAVQFAAVSNRTYAVQFMDDVATGAWSRLTDVVARNTNWVEVIHDPDWRTNRFYRVMTPAQP